MFCRSRGNQQLTQDNDCILDMSKEDFGVTHEYNEYVIVPQFAFSSEEQALQGIKEIKDALDIKKRLETIIAGRKQTLETYRNAGYSDQSLMCREVIYDIIELERIRDGFTK